MHMPQEIRKSEFFAAARDHDPHHAQRQDPAQPRQPELTALGGAFTMASEVPERRKRPNPNGHGLAARLLSPGLQRAMSQRLDIGGGAPSGASPQPDSRPLVLEWPAANGRSKR